MSPEHLSDMSQIHVSELCIWGISLKHVSEARIRNMLLGSVSETFYKHASYKCLWLMYLRHVLETCFWYMSLRHASDACLWQTIGFVARILFTTLASQECIVIHDVSCFKYMFFLSRDRMSTVYILEPTFPHPHLNCRVTSGFAKTFCIGHDSTNFFGRIIPLVQFAGTPCPPPYYCYME